MQGDVAHLKPMPGFVLVEVVKEKVGEWAIDQNEENQVKGVIVAIGDKVVNEWNTVINPPGIKVGDLIIHRHFGHEEWKAENGKTYRFVKFLDIMGKYE